MVDEYGNERDAGNMRRYRVALVGILLCCLSMALFCGIGSAEHASWDCPECGRTGITRNYCGKCGYPAPWIEEANKATITDYGTWGNIEWQLDEEGVLAIYGNGEIAGNPDQVTTWIALRSKVLSIVVGEGITKIGTCAFKNCNRIQEVELPQSLTEIDQEAFAGCNAIKRIVIPNHVSRIGNNAFSACGMLKEVVLPDGLKIIGDYAFENCKYLSNITIPSSVQDIGSSAFTHCERIEEIEIPEGVETIKASTFAYCKRLKSISIPSGVKSIQNYAFSYCEQLERLSIPGSVQTFSQIMDHCYALKEITVDASSNAYISVDGVLYTNNMKTIVKYPAKKEGEAYIIPDGVNMIYDNAFEGCKSLKSISIPEGVTYINSLAFGECDHLTNIIIPKSTTNLGNMSFYGCGALTDVDIPSHVYYMGDYAFANCSSLKNVSIHYGITTIRKYAFSGCKTLQNITIPGSVKRIYEGAFEGCTGLKNVFCSQIRDGIIIEKGNEYIENVTWLKAQAYSLAEGTCGAHVTWLLDEDGVLTISGKGAMKNYTDKETKPWQDWNNRIKTVVIEDGVTSIGALAFNHFRSLTGVTISNTVKTIGKGAFFNSGLKEVVIPDSVTSIGFDGFLSCVSLQKIEVSSGNKNYSSVDGILYDKNQKKLIACPSGRSTDVTVPNTVTRIESYAFENCEQIKTVALSEKTTRICWGAFWNCNRLASITIPVGINNIEDYAFCGCYCLKKVYYSGTSAKWKKIRIGSDNDCLLNASISYNE